MPGKYPGVSVAEKRAMLEDAGEEWPVCECHGEPKKWNRKDNRPSGGQWKCSEETRAANARYDKSEKGRAKKALWITSEKGRASKRARNKRFEQKRLFVFVGGLRLNYYVDPSKRKDIRQMLATFREQQTAEHNVFIESLNPRTGKEND